MTQAQNKDYDRVVFDEKGTFDRKRVVQLYNQVVDLFNRSTREGTMKTYWCVVIRKNGAQKGEWVNIRAHHPQNIRRIVVFEYTQKPVYVN